MLFYFIIFCGIGLILGFLINEPKIVLGIIAVLSICWLFYAGIWAFFTFIELIIGFSIARFIRKELK